MLKFNLYALIFMLSVVGCTKTETPAEVSTVQIKDLAREVQIPKALMIQIEEELIAEGKGFSPLYVFTPLKIQFTALTPDVLSEPRLQYELPKGGGDIDLRGIVTGDGSFYMSFPKEQFEGLPDLTHLYYISNSPIQKIDRESFGLGCGKWVDLKKSFSKLQKPDFLKLNTTELRYLPVLVGRYVFVFRQGNQINLTQVTLSDSRYPQEHCAGGF